MSILQQDRDLITSFAEGVGIKKLDKEIEDLLLSDIESKLLEIIQESKKIMRHSHRDFLKTDDVKHSMDKLSIPNVFGYPSSIPYTYERVPDQPNLWFIKSHNLNIKDFAVKPKLQTPLATVAYKMHFEALDGVQPRIAETVVEDVRMQQQPVIQEQQVNTNIVRIDPNEERKQEEAMKQEMLERQKQQYEMKLKKQMQTQPQLAGTTTGGVIPNKEFDNFYNMFIEVFKANEAFLLQQADSRDTAAAAQSDCDMKLREMLTQLENIPTLGCIFPLIVQFMGKQNDLIMKQDQPKIRLQIMILRVLKSVIYNKSFDMTTLLNPLIQILMQTLARDLPDDSLPLDNDIFKLKSAAAHLICMLVKSVAKQRPQLRMEITKSLLNYIYKTGENSGQASGYAMYGITVTLCQLGTEVLKSVLSQELPKIASILSQRGQQYQNNTRQLDAIQQSFQILQETSKKFIKYLSENEKSNEEDLRRVIEQVEKVFGIGANPLNPMNQQQHVVQQMYQQGVMINEQQQQQ